MGVDTKERTLGIMKSLLAFGTFESTNGSLSIPDIIDELRNFGIDDYNKATRLIDKINEWAAIETGAQAIVRLANNDETDEIQYVALRNHFIQSTYLKFMDVLLSLYNIAEREPRKSIKDVFEAHHTNGISSLGILSRIIIAIEKGDESRWEVIYGEEAKFEFNPIKLYEKGTGWVAKGRLSNGRE